MAMTGEDTFVTPERQEPADVATRTIQSGIDPGMAEVAMAISAATPSRQAYE
jgi:hypothetical protein